MKLGSLDESVTITVSVPVDGEQEDIYDLAFARARDIASEAASVGIRRIKALKLPFGSGPDIRVIIAFDSAPSR